MDRKNPIEHLLLSRCSKFHNDGEILKLLESRYSVSGDQKNFLVLKATDGGVSRAEVKKSKRKLKEKSLLGALQQQSSTEPTNKFNPLRTRNEFKDFVSGSIKYQDQLVRKIRNMTKKDPGLLANVKDLADLKIAADLVRFEHFLEMNRLWNQYISDLLGPSNNIGILTNKLSTSEFIGAYVEVSESACVHNIGMCGIVVWESQYNFVLVVPRADGWKGDISLIEPKYTIKERLGGLRIVCKRNSRFKVRIAQDEPEILEFEIIGNRLLVKSTDRANRRFKNHSVKDISV